MTYLTKMQERKRFIAEFARRLREARPGERVHMRVGDVLEVEPRADLVDFVNQAVDFGTRIDFHPHRFHEERSDIAKDNSDLARSLAPRRPDTATTKVDVTDSRTGRTVTGSVVINGRRVTVQRRAAFAISSGYPDAKKP